MNAVIDIDAYRVHWGAQSLTRWPPEVLADVRISATSKAFLQNPGMPPTKRILGLDYEWNTSLPRADSGRRVLAKYHRTPLLIDENAGGCVIRPSLPALPGSDPPMNPERWYNSSVEQFAQFLTEFHRLYFGAKSGLDRDAALDLVEARLSQIDAVPEDGPWAVLIMEERTGLTD